MPDDAMKTETQKPYKIYKDPENPYVTMEWKGYAFSEEFKDGTEFMLNLLIESKVNMVLADAKEMILIGMEEQQWMEKYFLPRAIRFGMKACAIVKPTNYFNIVAINNVFSKIDTTKMKVDVFESTSEARDWLLSLKGLPQ